MVLKFIQINIYKGKYFEDLIAFLKREMPDFVSMQEVTGGDANLGSNRSDLFSKISEATGLDGVVNHDYDLTDRPGYMGNAVFSKYKLLDKDVVVLSPFQKLDFVTSETDSFWPKGPRHLLDCTFDIDGFFMHAMSVHGAWTAPPEDTPETLRQAGLIANYLKKTKGPFMLGGDFNAVIQGKTIGLIDKVTNNLLFNSGILETTNPKVHKIKPRGYLIDFIFASPEVKLKNLTVPQITVSDHLPVIVEVEIQA
jgi:endonuclease/exonuclease/phosphatase family metal-dependent hydrolase